MKKIELITALSVYPDVHVKVAETKKHDDNAPTMNIKEVEFASLQDSEEQVILLWMEPNPETILAKQFSVKEAMAVLKIALSEDKTEGSYYYSWQANIAMAFYNEVVSGGSVSVPISTDEMAKVCNNGAKKFLDLLINQK